MIIENLKYDDLNQYKYLIDECFGESNTLEYYKENYKENNIYEIIVAKIDNKIVGTATIYKIDLFTFSFQPAFEIINVCVLPEYRKMGLAKSIFNYIIKYANDNGYKSLYLTCFEKATNAHKLYESVGFKKASSRKYNLIIEDIIK